MSIRTLGRNFFLLEKTLGIWFVLRTLHEKIHQSRLFQLLLTKLISSCTDEPQRQNVELKTSNTRNHSESAWKILDCLLKTELALLRSLTRAPKINGEDFYNYSIVAFFTADLLKWILNIDLRRSRGTFFSENLKVQNIFRLWIDKSICCCFS